MSMLMFSHACHGSIFILWILPHTPLYRRAFPNSTRSWLCLFTSFSRVLMSAISSGLRLLLSWRRWYKRFVSWIAGTKMSLLALYQLLHVWVTMVAVVSPARTTALQYSLYDMSREVNCNKYLLYSLCCSSSSQIFLQSISPLFSEDLTLYFMEVRLRSRDSHDDHCQVHRE